MSAKEPLGDYYADTAYTPTKRQQWEAANPGRDTIIGSRLSWERRSRDNGTREEYGYNNVAVSQSWESQCAEKGLEGDGIFKEMKVHYDNQRIMPPNYKGSARLFLALRRWVWNLPPELGQDMTSTWTGGRAWTATRF